MTTFFVSRTGKDKAWVESVRRNLRDYGYPDLHIVRGIFRIVHPAQYSSRVAAGNIVPDREGVVRRPLHRFAQQ